MILRLLENSFKIWLYVDISSQMLLTVATYSLIKTIKWALICSSSLTFMKALQPNKVTIGNVRLKDP